MSKVPQLPRPCGTQNKAYYTYILSAHELFTQLGPLMDSPLHPQRIKSEGHHVGKEAQEKGQRKLLSICLGGSSKMGCKKVSEHENNDGLGGMDRARPGATVEHFTNIFNMI